MPYSVQKADGDFKVVNTETGKVHARHTSRANAEAQVRLLRGVEHGMNVRTTSQTIGLDHGKAAKAHKAKGAKSVKGAAKGTNIRTTKETGGWGGPGGVNPNPPAPLPRPGYAPRPTPAPGRGRDLIPTPTRPISRPGIPTRPVTPQGPNYAQEQLKQGLGAFPFERGTFNPTTQATTVPMPMRKPVYRTGVYRMGKGGTVRTTSEAAGLSERRSARKAYAKAKATKPLGEGSRFKALAKSAKAGGARNPAAVAAAAGIKAHGQKAMTRMAQAGRARSR